MALFSALFIISVALARAPEQSSTSYAAPRVDDTALSPPARPTPEAMMADLERLAPPPMSDPPTQVEQGQYSFYISCMVCHADDGSGFSDEWRMVLNPFDRNCWKAKCHGSNHPPEGFTIPRYAPPVIGDDTLGDFETAAELYAYTRVEMPWSYPGLLETSWAFSDRQHGEEYWGLTAFLADANGISWGDELLGPDNADQVFLHPEPGQIQRPELGSERLLTGAVLALLLSASTLQLWNRKVHA